MKQADRGKLVADWHDRWHPLALQILARCLPGRADVPDLAQEVYLRLLRVNRLRQRRAYGAMAAAVGLCILFEGFFDSTRSIASELGYAQSSGQRLVSIDAILKRQVRSVRNVQWYDPAQLIGQFTDPGTGESVSRAISLDGAIGEPLETGKYPSVSPDGRLLMQHTDDGWVAHDIASEKRVRIEEPSDEHRDFLPYSRPVWSSDSRYVALIERYRPTAAQNAFEPVTIAGVPVIDLADRVSARKRWDSRITIFDRENPSDQQRILLNALAAELSWGPDGALYVSKFKPYFGDASTAVVRIRPGSRAVEEIYRTPGRFQNMVPVVHPDGSMMALVLDVDNRTWEDFQSLLLIDPETGQELRRLTQDIPILGRDYAWSPQGDEIYARVRNGGLDQIYAVPLQGSPRALTHGARRHYDVVLSPDGQRLAYQTEDGYGRKDIRVLDLETGEERVVLVMNEPAREFELGDWRHIRWDSTDGVRPFGFLFLPPDFDPTKRYPMLVDVHGGGEGSRLYLSAPLTISVAPGPLEWHAWAALGYVVLVPDYRSTGDYGPEVISARYETGVPAAVYDIEDILSGTRFVIDQGFVDPLKVAILGHSAGGKRVFILLTRHDLYAAVILNEAIAPDPVSSFIRLASGKNVGGYPEGLFRQLYGGELAEFPDRYKANYMFDSYRVTTPTLIMVGNEALGGVMHMPSEVVYSILRQHGVPTKMLKFVEEGHTYSRPESAKLAFEEVRRWLETHLPGPQDGAVH